jgi:predicted nuclease with TOPRIM domain
MNAIIESIRSINPAFFNELSTLQIVIGAILGFILTRSGQWILTIIYKYYMSKQNIETRENNMDNREFMFTQFEKMTARFDTLDESNKSLIKRLDGIDTRLDKIEDNINDLNRKWNSIPFASFFK